MELPLMRMDVDTQEIVTAFSIEIPDKICEKNDEMLARGLLCDFF